MMGNALTGLTLMGAGAADATVSAKPYLKAKSNANDSFSGIFNEKMREVSKSSAEPVKTSSKRPLESSACRDGAGDAKPAANVEPKAENTDNAGKTETNGAAAGERKSAGSAADKTGSDKADDGQKDQKQDASDETSALSLAASLLESIFSKLNELVAAKTGTTAQPTEGASEVGSSGGSNPLDMLKALLDGQTGKLKELLDKLQTQPQAADTQAKTLLDELQNLLSNVQQIKDGASTDTNGKIVIKLENGEEDPSALLAQLQTQGREIMDKLKIKLGSDMKQDLGGQSGLPPIQPEEASNSETVMKADASVKNDDRVPAANTKHETEAVSAKTGNKTEPVMNKQPQTLVSIDAQAQPQKSEAAAAAKPEKSDFLSEKPLSQSVANQVTMKIRLMAGENKQEMEVNLKPDSLGKLNLKIVHERGEILARITAENEQVKSILESNMQLLKDSLEKSGFSVQSLNVSVGNGNSGNQTQDQGSRKGGSTDEKAAPIEPSGRNQAGRAFAGWNTAGDTSSIDLSA